MSNFTISAANPAGKAIRSFDAIQTKNTPLKNKEATKQRNGELTANQTENRPAKTSVPKTATSRGIHQDTYDSGDANALKASRPLPASDDECTSECIRGPSRHVPAAPPLPGKQLCVPPAPPGVSLEENIAKTRDMSIQDFYQHVRSGGPWDYKQQGNEYEDFGNFHYGVMGAAMGIPEEVLLRGAGWAQQQAGTSEDEFGTPYDLPGTSSYGDDPRDQEMIRQGIEYYRAISQQGPADQIASGFRTVANSLNDVVDGAQNLANNFVDGVQNFANNLVDDAQDTTNNLVDGAQDTANNLVDDAQTVIDNFVPFGFGEGIRNDAIDFAQATGNAVIDGAQAAGNAVVDSAQVVGNAVVDAAQAAGNAVVDGAQAVGNAVVDGAQAVGNFVRRFF